MEGERNFVDNVLSKVRKDAFAADLQISLFMSALHNYRHDSLLRPFPPGYLHENGEKNIEALKFPREFPSSLLILCLKLGNISSETLSETTRVLVFEVNRHVKVQKLKHWINYNYLQDIKLQKDVASRIPGVKELTKSLKTGNEISSDVWKLVDWILDIKNIEIEQSSTASKFKDITRMTENSRNYHTPSHIFEIKHNEISNAQFDELRQDMNILHGYHGSRVENFYSILNNGLHAHLNKTSLFGEGTYLSSDLNVSILYSKFGEGWKHSLLGQNLSCIAVCEIIDHPDVKRSVQGPGQRSRARAENSEGGDVPERYFVVTNNQLIRVKYVMVYAFQSSYKRHFYQSFWVFQHPLASLVIIYVICLLLLGLSRTNSFRQFYKRLANL